MEGESSEMVDGMGKDTLLLGSNTRESPSQRIAVTVFAHVGWNKVSVAFELASSFAVLQFLVKFQPRMGTKPDFEAGKANGKGTNANGPFVIVSR